jgi:Fe-S-cluster-containing hydrogenase component 2
MEKKILMLDPEKCVGCRLCALACSFAKEGEFSLSKARIGVIWMAKTGVNVPIVCQHCEKPLCEDVCPMGAISRSEKTGAMVLNPDLCIGCKTCLIICPFGAPSINYKTRAMIKCDLCEGDPECVKYCVYGALSFVRTDEAAYVKKRAGAERIIEALKKGR